MSAQIRKRYGIFLDLVGDLAAGEAVERGLGHLRAAVLVLAGEGDDGLVRALALLQVVAHRVVVLDRPLDAAGDHHRPGLAADLLQAHHLLVEVVDHDLGLQPDRVVVALDVLAQLLLGPLGVELRVVFDRLDQLVVARDRRVALQHIQDEPLLDGLLHRVAVEGPVLGLAAVLIRLAEDFQRLVLGRGGEGEVAGVGQQLAGLHDPVDLVLGRLVFLLGPAFRQGHAHRGRRLAALAGVGLVDDDRELLAAVLRPDRVEGEGERLHRQDDDLLALGQVLLELLGLRALAFAHDADRRSHLGELLDRLADLLVEDAAVGDDDDRVEDFLVVLLQADELMGQPGDRVRLAAAGRVLDQVPLADALLGRRARAASAPRRAGDSGARSASASSCPSSRPSPRRSGRSSPGCSSGRRA